MSIIPVSKETSLIPSAEGSPYSRCLSQNQNNTGYYLLLNTYYGIVESCNVPQPYTIFLTLPEDIYNDVYSSALNSKQISSSTEEYLTNYYNQLKMNSFFMRSSIRSQKANSFKACIIEDKDQFIKGVLGCIEILAWAGNSYDNVLCIREIIDLSPTKVYSFEDMPLQPEIRFFAVDGKVKYYVNYYSLDNIKENNKWIIKSIARKDIYKAKEYQNFFQSNLEEIYQSLYNFNEVEVDLLHQYSSKISEKLIKPHSIDFMKDKHGKWWCIDIAPAHLSCNYDESKF